MKNKPIYTIRLYSATQEKVVYETTELWQALETLDKYIAHRFDNKEEPYAVGLYQNNEFIFGK